MTLEVDITKRQGAFTLEAQFAVKGGITVVFGPSGAGKSTLIKVIAGLERPDAGRIIFDGEVLFDGARNVPVHQRRIGFVFQEPRLFPHMSVEKNLRYAERFRRGAREAEARRVIGILGIGHLLERRPARLSGGEQARVALGRALLAEPRLLIADEPLASLDQARKAELLPYFERLRDEMGLPMLYVTHSATELGRLATRALVMKDGRVERVISGEEAVTDPALMPGGVRGVGALLKARVAAHHADGLTELEAGAARLYLPALEREEGAGLQVRVAASDVMLSLTRPERISALNILKGRIAQVTLGEGPGALVTLETEAGRILARVTRRSVEALGLVEGLEAYSVIKAVSVAREDIGANKASSTL